MHQILILAGVHGCEPQTTALAIDLIQKLKLKQISNPNYAELFDLFEGDFNQCRYVAIPDYNRQGLENFTRTNQREVDLNRNFPAKNWSPNYSHRAYFPGNMPSSETETQKLIGIIKDHNFDLFLAIHTNHFIVNPNPPQVNYDGPRDTWGYKMSTKLAEHLNLPLTDDIGYPTPGSLGSYATDLNIPCATLELDDKYNNIDTIANYSQLIMDWLQGL